MLHAAPHMHTLRSHTALAAQFLPGRMPNKYRDGQRSVIRVLLPGRAAGEAQEIAPVQAVPVATVAASATSQPGVSGRMSELKRMLDAGLITQADYDAKKAELLRAL